MCVWMVHAGTVNCVIYKSVSMISYKTCAIVTLISVNEGYQQKFTTVNSTLTVLNGSWFDQIFADRNSSLTGMGKKESGLWVCTKKLFIFWDKQLIYCEEEEEEFNCIDL